MKLTKTGSNTTELTLNNGTVVLFSYNTPVACIDAEQNAYRTNKKFSSTTTRHINAFVGSFADEKEQAFFEELVK